MHHFRYKYLFLGFASGVTLFTWILTIILYGRYCLHFTDEKLSPKCAILQYNSNANHPELMWTPQVKGTELTTLLSLQMIVTSLGVLMPPVLWLVHYQFRSSHGPFYSIICKNNLQDITMLTTTVLLKQIHMGWGLEEFWTQSFHVLYTWNEDRPLVQLIDGFANRESYPSISAQSWYWNFIDSFIGHILNTISILLPSVNIGLLSHGSRPHLSSHMVVLSGSMIPIMSHWLSKILGVVQTHYDSQGYC
jgi:hypothetical protein